MEPVKLVLVKPHPPQEIIDQRCPTPEKYKYAWEPISLKLIAEQLVKTFKDEIQVEIWHLIDKRDDEFLLEHLQQMKPEFIAFTEIDILVNQVSILAEQIKKTHPESITIVGGKQTSLLKPGDRFPFRGIDFAFRGDGPTALTQLIRNRIAGVDDHWIEGCVELDAEGFVKGSDTFSQRDKKMDCGAQGNHLFDVKNHSIEEYITRFQIHHSILPDEIRTAPILIGTGCPHRCYFCQSPVEYGKSGLRKAVLNSIDSILEGTLRLINDYGVNNLFSLESNLDYKNLIEVYRCLEVHGIDYIPFSGFIRAADIIKMKKAGVLNWLVRKGLRIVSIGLDVSFDSQEDIYNKSFSYQDMMLCLQICEESGIIPLTTFVANPQDTAEDLKRQLEVVKKLPVAEVDIRLAIAIRNTNYFEQVQDYLIYHPDQNPIYFDRQNYRYQSIRFPGKIQPEETYKLVNEFYNDYLFSADHVKYVNRMLRRYPDTKPFFQRQYQNLNNENRVVPSSVLQTLNIDTLAS